MTTRVRTYAGARGRVEAVQWDGSAEGMRFIYSWSRERVTPVWSVPLQDPSPLERRLHRLMVELRDGRAYIYSHDYVLQDPSTGDLSVVSQRLFWEQCDYPRKEESAVDPLPRVSLWKAVDPHRGQCDGCGVGFGEDECALLLDLSTAQGYWHEECLARLPSTIPILFAGLAQRTAKEAEHLQSEAARLHATAGAIASQIAENSESIS